MKELPREQANSDYGPQMARGVSLASSRDIVHETVLKSRRLAGTRIYAVAIARQDVFRLFCSELR